MNQGEQQPADEERPRVSSFLIADILAAPTQSPHTRSLHGPQLSFGVDTILSRNTIDSTSVGQLGKSVGKSVISSLAGFVSTVRCSCCHWQFMLFSLAHTRRGILFRQLIVFVFLLTSISRSQASAFTKKHDFIFSDEKILPLGFRCVLNEVNCTTQRHFLREGKFICFTCIVYNIGVGR